MTKFFNTHRFLFALLTIFTVFASAFIPLILPVKAATLTSAKDTIGDSRAGVASAHTFTFTTPSTTAIKTIEFAFCTTPSGSCTAPTGMVLTATPQLGTITGIAGSSYTASGTNTTCTGTGNTACTITLTVGTPATQTVTSVAVPFLSGITNPTTNNTSSYVRITTKDVSTNTIDSATVAFATLTSTSLAVTASVDPTFSFSIAAVTSGSVNNRAITVTSGTSASTIPFGTLSSGVPSVVAHDVTVVTNAVNGYTVTASASANPPLVDGTKNIDYFTGTNTSPTAWSSPNGTSASVNTGFFGYTTEDSSLGTGTADRFTSSGGNKWAGVTTTAGEIIYSPTGTTTETTRVGWMAEINSLQPPGSYTGSVILVATPTY